METDKIDQVLTIKDLSIIYFVFAYNGQDRAVNASEKK